jgi:hypothetical protein
MRFPQEIEPPKIDLFKQHTYVCRRIRDLELALDQERRALKAIQEKIDAEES